MLTFSNRYKSCFLGILFTLFSITSYSQYLGLFYEIGNGTTTTRGSNNGLSTEFRFNVLQFKIGGSSAFSTVTSSAGFPFASTTSGVSGNALAKGRFNIYARYWYVNQGDFSGVDISDNNLSSVPGTFIKSLVPKDWSTYTSGRTDLTYYYSSSKWMNLNIFKDMGMLNINILNITPDLVGIGFAYNDFMPTKIAITKNTPSTVSNCEGNNLSLSLTATGTGLSYQWQVSKNGGGTYTNTTSGTYSGTTTPNLTASGITFSMNNYKYRCIITATEIFPGQSDLTATSNITTLKVNKAPSLTSQPADKKTSENGSTSFTISATGDNLKYQWQLDDANLTNGTISGTTFSGVTLPTLTVSTINTGLDGKLFRAIVTSNIGCGTITSTTASVTVMSKVNITSQSTITNTICENNPVAATLSLTADGYDLSYQWKISTNNGATYNNVTNNVTGATYGGPTTAALSITNAPSSLNNALFICIVNDKGGRSQTTTPYLLKVNTKPTITLSPVSVTVCENDIATLTASAKGTSLTYQWQLDEANIANGVDIANGGTYTGVTTSSLTITNPSSSLSDKSYRVLVSGVEGCGSTVTSTTATLTVTTYPRISVDPISASICEGGNATISLTASGTNLKYTWQDKPTGSGTFTNTTASSVISGINSNILTFSTAPASAAKDYKVLITGTCGTTSSTVASIGLTFLPRVTLSPVSLSACNGSAATLSVTATGTDLSYQWQVSSTQTPTYTDISGNAYAGTTSNTLTITTNESLSANLYRAKITNGCGIVVYSAPAKLNVNSLPNATGTLSLTLCEFTSGTISVTSSGNTGLLYQWYENNVPLTNSKAQDNSSVSGATSNILKLSSVRYSKNGYSYLCNISSSAGCGSPMSSTISTLTVRQRPTITLQPINANNYIPSSPGINTYVYKASARGEINNYLTDINWYESTDGGLTYTNTTSFNGSRNSNTYSLPAASNTTSNGIATSTFTVTMPASKSNLDKSKFLYRCLFTGVCQSVTSNVVHLNIAPKIK
jgi:hypothetical protein